jgi:hypothetical protein
MMITSAARGRGGLALAAALAAALMTAPAAAQETDYCRKVRARAAEEAALLSWPRLVGEIHRYPRGASMGPTVDDTQAQVRLGASLSLTDLWRGARLGAVASADCELNQTSQLLQGRISEAGDDATRRALAAQVHYMGSQRPEWTALLDQARTRLASGLITVFELQDLRRSIGQLERKLEYAIGEQARLQALAAATPQTGPGLSSMARMADQYTSLAFQLERTAAQNRGPDPFRVALTGGVIPSFSPSPSDWYGVVEVSWSLGAPWAGRAAREALAARSDELRNARYEFQVRVAEVQKGMLAQAERTGRELKVLEREMESVTATLEAFQGREARGVDQARAVLGLELISLEADRVYLAELRSSLTSLAE